jgi:hypothetical protein
MSGATYSLVVTLYFKCSGDYQKHISIRHGSLITQLRHGDYDSPSVVQS